MPSSYVTSTVDNLYTAVRGFDGDGGAARADHLAYAAPLERRQMKKFSPPGVGIINLEQLWIRIL